jgi:hypothetical protein
MTYLWTWRGLFKGAIDSLELIDWIRVLKYLAATLLLLLLSGFVFGWGFVFIGFFFLPFWFIIWFLVFNALGAFNKV